VLPGHYITFVSVPGEGWNTEKQEVTVTTHMKFISLKLVHKKQRETLFEAPCAWGNGPTGEWLPPNRSGNHPLPVPHFLCISFFGDGSYEV
jgi:hypothetical protein